MRLKPKGLKAVQYGNKNPFLKQHDGCFFILDDMGVYSIPMSRFYGF